MAAAPGQPIRIANCSGFFGDRLSGAREMVEGGPIDVLTGDWLAELTMLILSRIRAKQPGRGFASTFVTQMEQVMGTCLDRGIKIVSNAGGLDPRGCADAVQQVADKLGIAPKIAFVDGDDLMVRLSDLAASGDLVPFANTQDGANIGLGDLARCVTANAYFGCWGIVEALNNGADVVITGRVTDAAVVCGPAAWHHQWARDDWNALAGAVVAGHIIECSGQATGGNYSFFSDVPGLARVGFPWADVAADGSAIIGKHDGTGGLVSIGTVASQILYEIGGPRYLGPDVTAGFDTIELEQVAKDRVRVSGTIGEPPPPMLKVALNEIAGYRNDVAIALTGLDIDAKADAVVEALWAALPYGPTDYESVNIALYRTDQPDPATNEQATAQLRITVKDRDEDKVGRAFSNAIIETALASIPGFYSLSGAPSGASAFGVYRPALVPSSCVDQSVHLGGTTRVVANVAPATGSPFTTRAAASGDVFESGSEIPLRQVETVRVPIGLVLGARSGDKGGDANLGVFARPGPSAPAIFEWIEQWLTVDRLRELLPETRPLPCDRYVFANLQALNFVIHGLLDEGVAASTRIDAQAKSLGEWFRSRHVDVPVALLT